MAKFVKTGVSSAPDFDYINCVVETREPCLKDEDEAHREACIVFRTKEPSALQVQAALIRQLCKFYSSEEDHKSNNPRDFKADEIISMPSSFFVELLEAFQKNAPAKES
jgi:hypothetical protein